MINLIVGVLLGLLRFFISVFRGIVHLFSLFTSTSANTWASIGQLFGVLLIIGVANWLLSTRDDKVVVDDEFKPRILRPRVFYVEEEEEG